MSAVNYLDLNGARVVTLDLLLPYLGAWVADLDMALPTATFAGQQTLTVGNLALLGASLRGGSFAGESKARLVGGFGGWQKSTTPAGYQNPSGLQASLVLQDTAAACGEQVKVLADTVIGQFWSVEGAPAQAGKVLRLLAPLWWVDPASGVTQVYATAGNTRPSTAIRSDFEVLSWDPGKGLLEVTTEDPASWMPGNTFTNPFMGGATVTISSTRIVCKDDGEMKLHVLGTP